MSGVKTIMLDSEGGLEFGKSWDRDVEQPRDVIEGADGLVEEQLEINGGVGSVVDLVDGRLELLSLGR